MSHWCYGDCLMWREGERGREGREREIGQEGREMERGGEREGVREKAGEWAVIKTLFPFWWDFSG